MHPCAANVSVDVAVTVRAGHLHAISRRLLPAGVVVRSISGVRLSQLSRDVQL